MSRIAGTGAIGRIVAESGADCLRQMTRKRPSHAAGGRRLNQFDSTTSGRWRRSPHGRAVKLAGCLDVSTADLHRWRSTAAVPECSGRNPISARLTCIPQESTTGHAAQTRRLNALAGTQTDAPPWRPGNADYMLFTAAEGWLSIRLCQPVSSACSRPGRLDHGGLLGRVERVQTYYG